MLKTDAIHTHAPSTLASPLSAACRSTAETWTREVASLRPQTPSDKMAQEPVVLSSMRGRVCLVELNRPSTLNAWNDAMFHQCRQALEAARADGNCACVVVTGRGRAFSAGADMTTMGQDTPPPAPSRRRSQSARTGDPALDSAFGR